MASKRKTLSSPQEQFIKKVRRVKEASANKALSSHAKVLYDELKFEWKGPRNINNGQIRISYRQAKDGIGKISLQTVAKAMQELQAKEFVVVTTPGHPGVDGAASGHDRNPSATRTKRSPALFGLETWTGLRSD